MYAQNAAGGFVLIGPQSIGATVSAMVTGQVRDSSQNNRTIIKGTVEDGVVFIISNSEFTIDSTDPQNVITGFDVVRQGVTLRNTTSGTDGVTSGAFRFYGTATNADKLNGLPASDYALSGAANFNSIVRFTDSGLTIGDATTLTVLVLVVVHVLVIVCPDSGSVDLGYLCSLPKLSALHLNTSDSSSM